MGTEYWLIAKAKLVQEKCVVMLTGRLNMTITVDWDIKPQTKQTISWTIFRDWNFLELNWNFFGSIRATPRLRIDTIII